MGADFTDPNWPRRKMFYEALMGNPVKDLESMVKHIQDAGLDQLALAYLQKAQPSTSRDELAGIKCQVLVLCGTEDSVNGSSEELAKLIPNAELIRVPGDHGSALKSKEFSNKVLSFLNKKL
jgi:pimeloyl-ACP methyl ester carboxylesterase